MELIIKPLLPLLHRLRFLLLLGYTHQSFTAAGNPCLKFGLVEHIPSESAELRPGTLLNLSYLLCQTQRPCRLLDLMSWQRCQVLSELQCRQKQPSSCRLHCLLPCQPAEMAWTAWSAVCCRCPCFAADRRWSHFIDFVYSSFGFVAIGTCWCSNVAFCLNQRYSGDQLSNYFGLPPMTAHLFLRLHSQCPCWGNCQWVERSSGRFGNFWFRFPMRLDL